MSTVRSMVRRAQEEPAERSGQLSPRSRRTERSVYTFFVDRTLAQTISGNASKAVPSSNISQTGPSCSVVAVGPMSEDEWTPRKFGPPGPTVLGQVDPPVQAS